MAAGRVVIVTGAARGLGAAIAAGLLEAGAAVVSVCRPRPEGEPPAVSASERYLRVDADITDEYACARVVAATLECFGSVDVLVNNAAVAHDAFPRLHRSTFDDVSPEQWRRVFDVNVNGTFLMTHAVVPSMLARGWGRIVNVSTSKGSMLSPSVLPYGPSKAAVEAMTAGWSARLAGSGVTVNAVLPGGAAGPRTPDKHWWPDDAPVWPAEIMVPPIRWLASDASDGVTGQRFVARLWDPAVPGAVAAERAGSPAGWPLTAEDAAKRPGL